MWWWMGEAVAEFPCCIAAGPDSSEIKNKQNNWLCSINDVIHALWYIRVFSSTVPAGFSAFFGFNDQQISDFCKICFDFWVLSSDRTTFFLHHEKDPSPANASEVALKISYYPSIPSKILNVYDFGMKKYTSQPITAQLFLYEELWLFERCSF